MVILNLIQNHEVLTAGNLNSEGEDSESSSE